MVRSEQILHPSMGSQMPSGTGVSSCFPQPGGKQTCVDRSLPGAYRIAHGPILESGVGKGSTPDDSPRNSPLLAQPRRGRLLALWGLSLIRFQARWTSIPPALPLLVAKPASRPMFWRLWGPHLLASLVPDPVRSGGQGV